MPNAKIEQTPFGGTTMGFDEAERLHQERMANDPAYRKNQERLELDEKFQAAMHVGWNKSFTKWMEYEERHKQHEADRQARLNGVVEKAEDDEDWSLAPEQSEEDATDPSPEGREVESPAPEREAPSRASKRKQGGRGGKGIGRGRWQPSAVAQFLSSAGFSQLQQMETMGHKFGQIFAGDDEEVGGGTGRESHEAVTAPRGMANETQSDELIKAIHELTKEIKDLRDSLENDGDGPPSLGQGTRGEGKSKTVAKAAAGATSPTGRKGTVAGMLETVVNLRNVASGR